MSTKLSMMVPDEPIKDPKPSSSSSLPLPKIDPKIKSRNKPVKAHGKNTASSSEGSSSNHRHDRTDHQDVNLNQDFGNINVDIMTNYQNFKKFDIVDDCSDHKLSAVTQPLQLTNKWKRTINKEWKILQDGLPDTIYVRVYEERMDLLRAVIKGAEGTPYHDGLFFFDIRFPGNYPHVPPIVNYHSGGLRINPNLYNNGKVCLSLLNTWIGAKNERWTPGTSTMLQVLVSIQGMVLNAKPYFNEPGFSFSRGTTDGENKSKAYNESTLVLSLKTMLYTLNKPPKNFEDLVIGHFRDRAHGILSAFQAYVNKIKKKTGSKQFKQDVKRDMKTLVKAFQTIGVEGLEKFGRHKSITQKIKAFFGF